MTRNLRTHKCTEVRLIMLWESEEKILIQPKKTLPPEPGFHYSEENKYFFRVSRSVKTLTRSAPGCILSDAGVWRCNVTIGHWWSCGSRQESLVCRDDQCNQLVLRRLHARCRTYAMARLPRLILTMRWLMRTICDAAAGTVSSRSKKNTPDRICPSLKCMLHRDCLHVYP